MENVLVVSGTDKGKTFLQELLREHAVEKIAAADNGGEARRLLLENDYDLVVINAPLKDESGERLAITVAKKTESGVLLIVKSDFADQVAEKVEDYGVMVVEKPLGRQIFYQALKMVLAARKRMQGLKNENAKLQRQIEDIRMVSRAKCALIEYGNYTEQEAHRYLEKAAMDERKTKRQVAEEILRIYES